MLAVTLAFGWKLLAPGDYKAMGDSAVAAAFSWSNLFFYWNTGYFDGPALMMPLRHTWSLGVEEQFYFVWPAMLMLAWLLSRRSLRALAAVVIMLTIVGFAVSVWEVKNDPKARVLSAASPSLGTRRRRRARFHHNASLAAANSDAGRPGADRSFRAAADDRGTVSGRQRLALGSGRHAGDRGRPDKYLQTGCSASLRCG